MSHILYYSIIVINTFIHFSPIETTENQYWTFPTGFLIGSATSAYQVEGAWNISDKGESVWDRYTHSYPEKIIDGENGDIACDSYHKYKEDIKILKQLGLDYYRFSISWPRILPTGYSNIISKDGVKYYHDLLDELEKNGIKPFVTLYHWDHPQVFQELGGWTNEVMVDLFGDYARVIFKEFGNRVQIFATINEPNILCKNSYTTGRFAPGLKLGKYAEYLCIHNILKSHARAYHIYNHEFRAYQNGKIGIILNCDHSYAKYENDTLSEEIAFQFKCGMYGSPIFSKDGDYPEVVKKQIGENSKFEGLQRSRLPSFSKEWINYIKGSADYLGLNHYSSKLVEPAPKTTETIYPDDHGLVESDDPKWIPTCAEHHKMVPSGFSDILRKIKEKFGNPVVYITENGMADADTLEDNRRLKYLHSYMKAMIIAIKKYHCNVKGYAIWSLLDNFEWSSGYRDKYGIIRVDFQHPNRTRTLKNSAIWLSSVLRTRKVQPIPNNRYVPC